MQQTKLEEVHQPEQPPLPDNVGGYMYKVLHETWVTRYTYNQNTTLWTYALPSKINDVSSKSTLKCKLSIKNESKGNLRYITCMQSPMTKQDFHIFSSCSFATHAVFCFFLFLGPIWKYFCFHLLPHSGWDYVVYTLQSLLEPVRSDSKTGRIKNMVEAEMQASEWGCLWIFKAQEFDVMRHWGNKIIMTLSQS